jgi:WD40 repeat protein
MRLVSLDLNKPNAEPTDYGVLGTKDRVHVCVEGVYIRDNVLYIPDANGAYAPGVCAVDISLLKRDKDTERIISTDPAYGKELISEEYMNRKSPPNEYTKNNPFAFRRDTKLYATKIWKTLGVEGSAVNAVNFDADSNLIAYTQKDGGTAVTIRNGRILRVEKRELPDRETEEKIAERFKSLKLPSHPGRQFLAVASAYAKMADGSYLVGTKDGCVALVKGEKVFSLGFVCNDGAVHSIASSPDGKRAVGVAGDPSSLGIVFTYDEQNGLNVEGFTYYMNGCGDDRLASVSCEPCCVAFSDDGKRLAIGARDNLGCVYEYILD